MALKPGENCGGAFSSSDSCVKCIGKWMHSKMLKWNHSKMNLIEFFLLLLGQVSSKILQMTMLQHMIMDQRL